MSPKRKPCRPSSCLEPGAWASWLLRGPWPARSEKRARLFPLLQPAAIVKKVNTPHSLTGKSSSQEWEEIKNLPQLSRRGPRGLVCAVGTPLGTQKERQFWSRTSTLSLGPSAPEPSLQWPGPPPRFCSSPEGQMQQDRRFWGAAALSSVLKASPTALWLSPSGSLC